MKRKLILTVAGAISAVVSSVSAELLLSDSFNFSAEGDGPNGIYTPGFLVNQGPVLPGFSGSWTRPNGFPSVNVSTEGLTYAGYGSSGGAVDLASTSSNFTQVSRPSSGFGITQPTLYFSYLIERAPSTSAGRTGIKFGGNGGDNFEFGVTGSSYYVNSDSTTGGSYTEGDTTLLLLRLDLDADGVDTFYLFADPDLAGGEPVIGSAVLTSSAFNFFDGGNIGSIQPRFVDGSGSFASGDAYTFDEIRVGTTFDSITSPIPEPGTYAMLSGLLALGAVMIRRRK